MRLYKLYVLFVILAFLLFNSIDSRSIAPNELSLSLQMEPRYGTSQLITGTLTITAGEIKSDSLVKVYINNNKKAQNSYIYSRKRLKATGQLSFRKKI